MKYAANIDMPIKYTFQLGGGLNGRTIKKGEVVTMIGVMNDINSQSVSTMETLHRIEKNHFDNNFTLVK
jgi:hypothetical protein